MSQPDQEGPEARHVALGSVGYAVVDVETTGFSRQDRIVEVAVVHLDGRLAMTGRFVSLVNPQAPIPNARIHGITAQVVAAAPTFAELAGELIHRLQGRVLVAHNAPFDLRFLSDEFERAGLKLPHLSSICTLALSRRIDRAGPQRLGELCRLYGISLDGAHSALQDAAATARLFQRQLSLLEVDAAGPLAQLGPQRGPAPPERWPRAPRARRAFTRDDAFLAGAAPLTPGRAEAPAEPGRGGRRGPRAPGCGAGLGALAMLLGAAAARGA